MRKLLLLLLTALPILLSAQGQQYISNHYDKAEYEIPMRDGVTLFTQVYTPKDQSRKYPFMLNRTCYSIKPYGGDQYPENMGPSPYLVKDGYIFVRQDVRGRYMSGGTFDNMRPNISGNKKKDVDESSDTFDTIEWLLKNIKNNNGRVGQWGISYPGFYTAASIPDAHPALKASSPQAPIGDFFFDDFHHNGALLQSYLKAYPVFGLQKSGKTQEPWYTDQLITEDVPDGYQYNLNLGPLSTVTDSIYQDNFFWQQMVEHPNYDDFWQKRGLIQYMKNVNHAVMTVGGWFDAEDLYGPLNIYKNIETSSPDAYNILVMGPWSHGDWHHEGGYQAVNDIYFGDSISTFYQKQVEREFFNSILKENKKPDLPEAMVFDTGLKEWKRMPAWPPRNIPPVTLSFHEDGKLGINESVEDDLTFDYISDPAKPVPYRSETEGLVFTPRAYMTDDQRHAGTRPDVLTFQTAPLKKAITLAGEVEARLKVILSSTDADFIVKIIDVLPPDEPRSKVAENVEMGGYEMLVRAEVMRGRFRDSFSNPQPFVAGEPAEVDFRLQDMLHTFRPGHRIMVQIQSTWFPYIDRNPQTYVDNIYKAKKSDFKKETITILGSSTVEIGKTAVNAQIEMEK